MRVLVLVWPADNQGRLAFDRSQGTVLLAIDRIVQELVRLGHSVTYVNAAVSGEQVRQLVAKGSRLPLLPWSTVTERRFDGIWHAIRDPTPRAAFDAVANIMRDLSAEIPVWNSVTYLQKHSKAKYLPLLARHGIGVDLLECYPAMEDTNGVLDIGKCWAPQNAAYVSHDKQAVRVYAMNNDRSSLQRFGVTLRYIDNAGLLQPGFRTFFRIPFALGKTLPGSFYYCPEKFLTPKSGSASRVVPFNIPEPSAGKVSMVMHDLGVDIAHLEGLHDAWGRIRLFDINPFPSSSGTSLTPMSVHIARRLSEL